MKKTDLQIIYGHSPFTAPVKYLPEYYATVWIKGCDGEYRFLSRFTCDDRLNRSTDWKNGALTAARKFAEKEGEFYGIKPKRFECASEVPRSINFKSLIEKYSNEKN